MTYGDAVIQVDFGPSITADGERYKTVVMRSALTDASIQADIAKYIGQMYANPNRNPFAATDANGNVFLSIDLTDIQHPTYYSAAAAQYAYYSSGAYHLGPDLSTGNAIDSIVSPTILTTWNNGSVFTAYPLPTDSAAATAAAIAAASLATSAQVAGITEWAIYANVTQSSNVAGNAKFIGTGQGPGVCAGNIFGNAVFTNGSSIAPAGSISEDALFDATSVNMDGAVWGNAVLIGPASGTPIAHTGAFNSNVYTTGLVDLSQATITGSLYYWGSMTPAGPLGIGANGVDDYRLRRIGTTWYLWSAAVGGYAESQSLVGHYVGFVDNSFTGGFDVSGSGDSYTISNWTLLDGNGNPVVPPANPIIFQIKAATQLTAWPLALVKEMFVPAMQSFATPGRSIATDSHGNVIADVMLSDEQISIIAYEIASQTQIDPQTIRNAMAKALTASVESGSIDAKLNDKTGFSLASTGLDAISATSPTAKAITFKDKLLQVWDRLCGRVVHDKAAKTVQLTSDDGHTVRTTQSWTESTSNEIQGPMS